MNHILFDIQFLYMKYRYMLLFLCSYYTQYAPMLKDQSHSHIDCYYFSGLVIIVFLLHFVNLSVIGTYWLRYIL